jgi:hypothetical protein
MDDTSDRVPNEFESFAARWFTPTLVIFLRSVRDAALAYDLTTEALATARLQWASSPGGEEAVGWLLQLGTDLLDAAVERGSVPSVERRRGRQPHVYRLTVDDQHEIMALAEAHVELPEGAREVAAALARAAPPLHVLPSVRLSGLVEAAPLPDHDRSRDAC